MAKVAAAWLTDSAGAVAIIGYRFVTRLSGPSDYGETGSVVEAELLVTTDLYYFTAEVLITVHFTEKKNLQLDRVTSVPLHL